MGCTWILRIGLFIKIAVDLILSKTDCNLQQAAGMVKIVFRLLPFSNCLPFLMAHAMRTTDEKLLINAMAIDAKQAA